MDVCFHGGAGKVAKPINFIMDLAKNMKAMSLKAKAERRRTVGDDTAAASASAKIAPEAEEEECGGKRQEFCDKCCSALPDEGGGGGAGEEEAAVVGEEGDWEWEAEPEPGVLMTLAPRRGAGATTNRLRKLRFREEEFDAAAAQGWWAENYDRVVELYSIVQSDSDSEEVTASAAAMPVTPCQSEDEEEEVGHGMVSASPSTSTSNFSGVLSSGSGGSAGTMGSPILGVVTAPSTTGGARPARAEAEHDDGFRDEEPTAPWREWVEEYDAGVFITVRAYPDHRLQLRRVELSRERFGEVKARVWWQENKDKLNQLYSSF